MSRRRFSQLPAVSNDPIPLKLQGPAGSIGDNTFSVIGGTGAAWIRARQQAGTPPDTVFRLASRRLHHRHSDGRRGAASLIQQRAFRIAPAVAAISLALVNPCALAQRLHNKWTGTWAMSPAGADSQHSFADETLRQIVHTSVGGTAARVHVSNLFGTAPLHIEDVRIARRLAGSSIDPGSDCVVLFDGRTGVFIPPGGAAVSDPVQLHVPALGDIAISMYLPAPSVAPTFNPAAHQTSYVTRGDVSADVVWVAPAALPTWSFLTGLDVQGSGERGSVVTLGASITNGYKSTDNADRRWPDLLAVRLRRAGLHIGVLNEGIAGNRLLADGAGPNALSRFDRDVLEQPGVRWVIFSDDPINDLGSTRPPPSADALIAAIRRLIARAHAQQILFFCSTLTPYEGAGYWTSGGEQAREQVNAFLRSAGSGCDGIVDRDKATHDPKHPTRFLAAYDSGDHLHPNDAGMQAIADTVDLRLLRTESSGRRPH